MDLFLATCQGLGLALAAGMLAGSPGPGGTLRRAAAVAAALVGAALFALSLADADHPAWPGVIPGAPLGALAAALTSTVVTGARSRAGGEGVGVTAQVLGAAAVVAVLAIFASPASLLVLVALLWLWYSRRRREARKHEGLRVLR